MVVGKILNKKQKKWLMENLFPIYKCTLKPFLQRNRFSVEKGLIEGRQKTVTQQQSIIVFTTFKCASTLLSKLTTIFYTNNGLTPVDFDIFFSHKEQSVDDWFSSDVFLKNAFHNKGYVYGPFRSYRDIPGIKDYKIFLLLRDPRDVLTSYYYSVTNSHGVINSKLIEKRRRSKKFTLDEFVQSNYQFILDIYKDYVELLLDKDNVTFWKYEDMIERPAEFIKSFSSLINIDIPEQEIKEIVSAELTLPEKEDIKSHRRSGKMGQYKEKLSVESIGILNNKFEGVLNSLGYELSEN